MIEFENDNYRYFLEANIYPTLNITEVNEENVQYVYDYIVEAYELPLIENDDERFLFINGLLHELAMYLPHRE